MKKSLRPQQSAPVKRENTGTAKGGEKGVIPQFRDDYDNGCPFAWDEDE